jgi:hypothetical protein
MDLTRLEKLEKDVARLKTRVHVLESKDSETQSQQEKYYQNILEKRFPGAGHRHLITNAGSHIYTDVTSPDDWNPKEHDGMPSFNIEIKKTLGYKEILTQLEMAEAVLPRDMRIGALFVNPSIQKLKDIFELFHPHGIKLCFFDHHDQLWWFDGKEKKQFEEMWKSVKKTPSNNEVLRSARDNLLTQVDEGGVEVDAYVTRLKTWLEKYEPSYDIPGRNKFLESIDLSLCGKKLERSQRRFRHPGAKEQTCGWKGWKFV